MRAADAKPAPKSTRRHGLPLFLVQLVVNVALVAILVGFVTRWLVLPAAIPMISLHGPPISALDVHLICAHGTEGVRSLLSHAGD